MSVCLRHYKGPTLWRAALSVVDDDSPCSSFLHPSRSWCVLTTNVVCTPSRKSLRKLVVRVDDRNRVYAGCIIASWHYGFGPQLAFPGAIQAVTIFLCSIIDFPYMPSWLCNVVINATENCLTALKCRAILVDVTIESRPNPIRVVTQDQLFIWTSPFAAITANI